MKCKHNINDLTFEVNGSSGLFHSLKIIIEINCKCKKKWTKYIT